MRLTFYRVAIVLLLFAPLSASADSWRPPSVKSYESSNGHWKLTVYPRHLTSALDYFQDKVDGNAHAGGVRGDVQKSPIGHLEEKHGGHWQTVWKGPLVNDVAPVEAVVANDGSIVTFDNWHSVGWGEDAVVIYGPDGTLVRSLGVDAFLPKHYFNALPRSVSSIHWRGQPRVDEGRLQVVIPVVVPTAEAQEGDSEEPLYVDVRFQLSDGSLLPITGAEWVSANASAVQADKRRKELLAEERRRFVSPLSAPAVGDVTTWHLYLVDAFFRLDPEPEDQYPSTQVIPMRTDEDFEMLARYLGEALSEAYDSDDVIMVAGISQDVLVETLTQQAKKVQRGSLAKARIYVAADDAHMPSFNAALAHSGATVIQLDINTEIPQRKERLERYLKGLEESED